MQIPKVEYFFCCLRLRTGALFLGWAGAIFGAIAFVHSVYKLIEFDDALDTFHKLALASLQNDKLAKNLVDFRDEHRAILILYVLIYAIGTISSVLLLVGVYKKNGKLIKHWLSAAIVTILLGLILQILVVHSAVEDARVLIAVLLLFADIFILGGLKSFTTF